MPDYRLMNRVAYFENSRTRVRWAKKDISNFRRSVDRFFRNTKYTLVIEPDPDGIHEIHKLRIGKQFPTTLTQKTISACENLRSALDLLAVDVARLTSVLNVGKIHFPFCKAAGDLKSRLNSDACKPLPDEIKALFASYEPYMGGSDLLWAINELANTSKHNSILHVGFKSGVALPYMESEDAIHLPIEIMEGMHGSVQNEIVFARTQQGLKWKYHLQMAFGVAFGPLPGIEGKDVYPNLVSMVDAVNTIVNETEAKCRNLRLL